MKAEAIIGTVLGTCELQGLIGRGGLGAVYLAQQSRPRRLVAVKVFSPDQHATFLEHFRQEADISHVQHLSESREYASVERVVPKDYEVDIHLLGKPINGGP